LLGLLAINAGCGNTTRALGSITDADPSDGSIDGAMVDATPLDLPHVDFHSPPAVCGDGQLDTGEECDDGNVMSGDGCTALCQVECPAPSPVCLPVGSPGEVCGDGVSIVGEACDDGNTTRGDGCSNGCAIERGWTCPLAGHPCFPICGDGIVTGPETCDDGNQQSGDGCSSTCLIEGPCFASDGAPAPCLPTCGNGRIDGSEECDDGPRNADVQGVCSTTCHRLYSCGDGVVTPPEECDLGPDNALVPYVYTGAPSAGCTAVCTLPRYCGDGYIDPSFGEQCDLGSLNGKPINGGGRECVRCDVYCQYVISC
jgi:cysteine-rich repeat protein